MTASKGMPLAETLADFVSGFDLRSAASQDALTLKAKQHILDAFGVALAATTMEDGYSNKLLGMVDALGSSPECTIIGSSHRAAPPLAALMNGSLIHGCEFDDRYLQRVVHTESFGVATALAGAEHRKLDGWALMEGWILAAEVAIRLALGCNPSKLADESGSINSGGFHTTSVFGTIGSAAAASRLLGLTADQTADAISLAASFCSGTTQGWGERSGRNKSIQPGWAAMSGVMAALTAQRGYECSHTTLDGPKGLFAAHAWRNGWSIGPVLDGLGDAWRCLDIAFKLYPAGGLAHNVIGCTKDLVLENDIQPDEVEGVEVTVAAEYGNRFRDDTQEEKSRRQPGAEDVPHGSWSWNVARMILSREIGLHNVVMYTTVARSPDFDELKALAQKVTVKPGTEVGYSGDERPTTVVIKTQRGTFERSMRKSVGHPDDVRTEDIVGKFRLNAGLVTPKERAEQIVAKVLDLERLERIEELAKLLGGRAAGRVAKQASSGSKAKQEATK